VVAVSDALVLATRVDGVVLVLNAGKTKRDLARRARALLEKVNARILGVVLNNAPVDASIYRYYQQVDSSH
jgi:non-specific protein-tyrosine kinase